MVPSATPVTTDTSLPEFAGTGVLYDHVDDGDGDGLRVAAHVEAFLETPTRLASPGCGLPSLEVRRAHGRLRCARLGEAGSRAERGGLARAGLGMARRLVTQAQAGSDAAAK
ncbi:hypothetical protein ZWY2020_039604 [Hordeum vulgare]|nr:hypothetical protein ZWY2020_039604 [Hordeum vulgare]